MDNYHVTFNSTNDNWIFFKAQTSVVLMSNRNKAALIGSLNTWFKNNNLQGSVKIHAKDGTFQEERTYPRAVDPPWTKG